MILGLMSFGSSGLDGGERETGRVQQGGIKSKGNENGSQVKDSDPCHQGGVTWWDKQIKEVPGKVPGGTSRQEQVPFHCISIGEPIWRGQ